MKRLKFVKNITNFYVNDHRISLITNAAMAGEYKIKQTTVLFLIGYYKRN